MKSFILFFSTLISLVSSFPQSQFWKQTIFQSFNNEPTKIINCGTSNDILQILKWNIEPNPPQPGKNLRVTGRGILSQDIKQGSYADVQVKMGFVKILTKQFDTCEEAKEVNKTCPIKKGEVTLEKNVDLPFEIPRAKFTVDVRVAQPDHTQITCIQAIVDFSL